MNARILVIDDEQDLCDLLKSTIERTGATVVACTSARDALVHLATEEFDAVLTDLGMSEMGGLEVCERVEQINPALPVLVVTGHVGFDDAVAAMRAGAYDFITKPISDPELITIAIARAVEHYRLRRELKRLQRVVEAVSAPSHIVGSSGAMRGIHDTIARISAGDASVLIHGETGTGKELVARRIHALGARKDGPFVAVNCAAIPSTLFDSELFGHVRGAFTDAKSERVGLFVQANHGTLFLDEIGEMPLEMQAKCLRALQERKVRPVGSNTEIPFDVRLVTATNRDLEELIEQKRFREDLFYRINVVRIRVPPLRERASDVLELAQYFLKRHGARSGKAALGFSAEAARKLIRYNWPGNVRELENCVERAVAFALYDEITAADLPDKIGAYAPAKFVVVANDAQEIISLDELEERYVTRALSLLGDNKTLVAEALHIDRRTLYRKIERWQNLSGSSPRPASESPAPLREKTV
jgi:DNA-binding NtrC family response regulator